MTRPALLLLAPLALLIGCRAGGPPAGDLPDAGTIRALTMGDRACYITVENEQGVHQDVMGEFSFCEDEALIDRRVRLTYEQIPVAAASCEGDPACTETENVSVVTAVQYRD